MFNDRFFQRVELLRLPLVNHFYARCNYRVKCGRQDLVFSLSQQGNIIAAARLLPYPQDYFVLRNLCVAPEARKQGVATFLVEKILVELVSMGNAARCYCYVLPHLQDFYLALGFSHLTVEQVPPVVAETHVRNCARKRGWVLMGYGNHGY